MKIDNAIISIIGGKMAVEISEREILHLAESILSSRVHPRVYKVMPDGFTEQNAPVEVHDSWPSYSFEHNAVGYEIETQYDFDDQKEVRRGGFYPIPVKDQHVIHIFAAMAVLEVEAKEYK